MSNRPPILSVVIPTRNRRELAAQALESALAPLPFPHEVILSDNGSSDSTPDLRALFPSARYLRQEKTLPMAEHWNRCVSEAKGKYVKLLCDDDWLIPGALESEVAALEADPGCSMVASARLEVSEGGKKELKQGIARTTSLEAPFGYWIMLKSENIVGPPSAVTFRKTSFQGFPEGFRYAADWAAWILLAGQGSLLLRAEPGVNFRLHSSNLTHAHVEDGTDFLEVQSLRRACLARLNGVAKIAGIPLYGWIFAYRLARRLCRYMAKRDLRGLGAFLRRLASYQAPHL